MAPDFGNFPQQVTALSAAGLFISVAGLLTKLLLGKGQLNIAAQKVAVEAKQVANAQEADVRDSYAELQRQITEMGQHHLSREREIDERWRQVVADNDERWRQIVLESENRHAECVRQRDELSQRVLTVENRLMGTIRQFVHFQQRVAEALARGENAVDVLASLQPFTDPSAETS